LETHVERISNLQDIKKAELDRETGLFLYEDMMLGRRFEDKCAEMYYRGKMFGFVHLYNGQEAISTGVIGAMKKKHDWFCSTYRDHVHALSAGVPSFEVMRDEILSGASLNRFVTHEDLAEQAHFLCSPLGKNISGQAVSVCGNIEKAG